MKVIAPRLPTLGATGSSGATLRVPEELVAEQQRRLEAFIAVAGSVWAFGLVMDAVVLPRTVGAVVTPTTLTIEAAAVATSLVLLLYVHYRTHAPPVAGLLCMLLNAAGVALINTWARDPTRESMGHLSWTTFVILASAAFMPANPRKVLAASLFAASLEPLGVWLAHLRGIAVPGIVETLALTMPNYVSALVATVPSQVFQGLGRRLREAQALGSYQLVELLGRGGMGEVWRAQHRWLARHAAIKVIRPEMLGGAGGTDAIVARRRFEREAQATASLSSPHSIRLFDFGITEDGNFYYAMELLTGRNLETIVREFGPLPASRVIYLLRQVCHSLAEAHARGLVHRDIKPANIYVCRMALDYDFVKVLDFGLVKLRPGDPMDTLVTSSHVTTGTPAYMAPESVLGQGNVDRRADIYSLGCVAYYLLTGQLVFPSATPMQSVVDHVHTRPVAPSERTELPISAALDALVLACLEKSPAARPPNVEELLQRLDSCDASGGWTGAMAQRWWKTHLPELSGPLPSIEVRPPSEAEADAETV
jgi:serine/threonine protein kinase